VLDFKKRRKTNPNRIYNGIYVNFMIFFIIEFLDVADPKMAGEHGSCTIILDKSQWQTKIDEAKSRRKIVRMNSFFLSFMNFKFHTKVDFLTNRVPNFLE